MPSLPVSPKFQPHLLITLIDIWLAKSSFNINFFWGLIEKATIFSVSIIADLIAWSFEKPVSIPLQYLFEKLLEILFLKAIALGFVAVEENPLVGLITKILRIIKLIIIFNNLNLINWLILN